MSLLDELRKKEDALKSAGVSIRADAREKGASFSYIDPNEPNTIVVEQDGDVMRKRLPAEERRATK